MEQCINIGGRLHSAATGNTVAGANEVLDDAKNKKQSVINAEVDEIIGDDNIAGTIKGRIKTAESKLDILNGDSSTSGSIAKAVADAKTELIGGATSNGNTLKKVEDRTATLETTVGSNGSVDQRIAAAKTELIGDAASDYNTMGKLEDKIQAEAFERQSAISGEAQARQDAIAAETDRATTREDQIFDLVHTPKQNYVTVATYADLANIASPSDYTIYRVSSYNGNTSQVDNTVYSEYAYDGTNFVFLCVNSQISEVYDISAAHSNNTYVDLAAALDGGNNIPQELRKGGMSIKFVQSSDNTYVQFRYMGTDVTTAATFTNVANWQGIDNVPTAGSKNLVESGGVYSETKNIKSRIGYLVENQEFISGEIVFNNTVAKEGDVVDFDLTASNGTTRLVFYDENGTLLASPAMFSTNQKSNYTLPTGFYVAKALYGGGFLAKYIIIKKLTNRELLNDVSQIVKSAAIGFTDNARLNSVLRTLFIDLSGYTGAESLHDLYFNNFGYYTSGNSVYFQLKNHTGTLLAATNIDYISFNGHIEVTGDSGVFISMDVDIDEFYNNTPHQINIDKILSPAFIPQVLVKNNVPKNIIGTDNLVDKSVSNEKLKETILVKDTDVTEEGEVTNNHFWNPSSNAAEEGTGWRYIAYNVQPGESYIITAGAGLLARLWSVYDSSNNRLDYSSDSSSVSMKTETVTIPANGTKLIVNSHGTNYSVFLTKLAYNAEEVYVNYEKTIKQYVDDKIQFNGNILYGKTLVCCGDSITYGEDMDAEGIAETSEIEMYNRNGNSFARTTVNALKTYGYQIAARNNMIFYNDGISGSTMQGLPNRNGFSLENGRYTTLPEHIDYLTIWFGWNDTAAGSLGTIEDSTNESYYGGYNVVLPYLINKYPYTKICLCVPFGCDADHRQAIRDIANKWGVACWDNYQGGTPLYFGKEESVGVEASIVTSNRAKFQANGAHPNFKGHRQLADMIEHFLRGI